MTPAVNQAESHPYFAQRDLQEANARHGILTQAWSPIGGITHYRGDMELSTLNDPVIGEIAAAHDLTPAQVMLRRGLQQGRSVIPKSVRRERIAENLDAFRIALSDEELDALETGERGGRDPDAITLETVVREIPEA